MLDYNYPSIDMKRTGLLLKKKVEEAGYSVKELQETLMLSCPQPIYRWFKGNVLPSINHLYALSQLLQVHMEELLVPESRLRIVADVWKMIPHEKWKRMSLYIYCVQQGM